MERDFLGLGAKTTSTKHQGNEECSDKDVGRVCGSLRSFRCIRSLPQFLSFDGGYTEKPWMSSRLSTAPSMFDASSSGPRYSGSGFQMLQKNSVHESKQMNHMMQMNQNVGCSTATSLVDGGNPVTKPLLPLLPSSGSTISASDSWNPSKSKEKPAQLTIFYAGSVSVYNDVSPEKAHAIMLLAGNGSAANVYGNSAGSSVVPSPTTHGLSCNLLKSSVTSRISSTPVGSSPRPLLSSGSIPDHSPNRTLPILNHSIVVPSAALPQARKASLARFLEKRKERAISVMPYSLNKEAMATKDSSTNLIATSAEQ